MTNRGSGNLALTFLTSALDTGEWPASHPSNLYSWGNVPGTHCVEGWVDTVEKRKISCPC
jgi:hypothetical protein